MSELTIVESLFRLIRERKSHLEEVLLLGQVPDYTEFKVVRARVNELARLEQDFKDLLVRKMKDESPDT